MTKPTHEDGLRAENAASKMRPRAVKTKAERARANRPDVPKMRHVLFGRKKS